MFTPLARDDDDGNNDNVGRYCFVWSAIGVDKLRLRALKNPTVCVCARLTATHPEARQKKKKAKHILENIKFSARLCQLKCDAKPKKVLTAYSAFTPPPYKAQFACFVMSQRAPMLMMEIYFICQKLVEILIVKNAPHYEYKYDYHISVCWKESNKNRFSPGDGGGAFERDLLNWTRQRTLFFPPHPLL